MWQTVSDYISKSAVTKVLEDCHLDKELFEKDVFDSINALPTLDEKEIIRKAFERIAQRLEEARAECKELQRTTTDAYGYMKMKQGIDCAKDIVKEESGIE